MALKTIAEWRKGVKGKVNKDMQVNFFSLILL